MVGIKRAPGAGRKPAHPLLKKEMISVKIPHWMIEKLRGESQSQAVLIETALKQQYDWKQPDINEGE